MQCSLNKGSSASQLTAAKVMDTNDHGFQDVQDKQQMQYPLSLWSKCKIAPKLLKNPKSECPDIWIRLPRHKWPKSPSSMEDPVVPLERNLYGHPLAGLLWERQFEKVLLKHGWEKVFKLGMFIRPPCKRTIPIRVSGQYQNWQARQKT